MRSSPVRKQSATGNSFKCLTAAEETPVTCNQSSNGKTCRLVTQCLLSSVGVGSSLARLRRSRRAVLSVQRSRTVESGHGRVTSLQFSNIPT
eukprot:m.57967 g.57967  ORF g.57967 m.57967 type:complete len:92 (+) comp34774_c1_seq3:1909-2184(+)